MGSAKVTRLFQRWVNSQSGNVAIIAALMMPVMIGFAGMGIEVGYWFYKQRMMQAAADIAVYNATVALRNGEPSNQIITQASTDAANNGWTAANGTIQVHMPPQSGAHQNANSVEILLTESEQRLFTKIFINTPVQISVRTVANYTSNGLACMLALNKTANQAIRMWGNNSTTLNGCNVMSNSFSNDAISVGGNANLTTPCALAVGSSGVHGNGNLTLTSCHSPTNNSAPATDPYRNLPAPAIPQNCANANANPLQPGRYCGGISLNGNGNKTFSPGVYIIDGGSFKVNGNLNVSGAGVTFYLTNGATVQFNGNINFNFSAPTAGTYSGMLFFGDRTQPNATQKFNGNAASKMTGAIYFPSQQVQMTGNFSGVNGCQQVIADTIDYSGNANFAADCAAQGMTGIPTPGGVALVE